MHARTACDVFLLQEPHLFKGNLTAIPWDFLAFHEAQQGNVWSAIVAHKFLLPIAHAGNVHTWWV